MSEAGDDDNVSHIDTGDVLMTPGRTDLAVGLFLLGCFYGIAWMSRRRPKSRLERMAGDVGRTGRVTRAAAVGLVRAAMAEGELLDRARRSR
jgi:hypothetical protein